MSNSMIKYPDYLPILLREVFHVVTLNSSAVSNGMTAGRQKIQ